MNDQRKLMAEARSQIYQFLSQAYRSPPTRELIEKMTQQPEFIDSFISFLGHSTYISEDLQKYLTSNTPDVLLEDLTQEYNSLFVIPAKGYVRPYESVYVDTWDIDGAECSGLVMGSSTVHVKDIYETAGVELSDTFKDLPDHLAVELEFMSYLAEKEANLSDSAIEADKFLEFQYNFLNNHLSKWVGTVCNTILDSTTNPFYVAIATLTVKFINDELD